MNEMFDSIVANAIALTPPKPNDYIGDNGLLICGICNTPRQVKQCQLGNDYILPVVCKCRKEELDAIEKAKRAEDLAKRKEIALPTAKYRSMTFEASDCRLVEAENYVNNWGYMLEHNKGLLLYGGVGCGKTYMAAAIANRLIECGEMVYMDNMAALSTRMNDMFNGGRDECLNRVRRCNLMILDDFGAEKSTTTTGKNTYEIINARAETGKPMVVTTNLAPKSMNESEDLTLARIYSRLKALHPIKVEGTDRRAQVTKEDFSEMERMLKQ